MKQKYLILRNDKKTNLIIKEFAELDKEVFSFLCEESFDDESVESAIAKGKEALIATLRTKNLFPIGIYAEKIAETVMGIYESGNDQSVELFFNDLDLLTKDQEKPLIADDIESEPAEIDDLLDDVPESSYDEKKEIINITHPLKVTDDDPVNVEDED